MTCRMLANTGLPVDKVARRSGMRSGDQLAKIFRKRLSISPSECRARSRSDAT
jgi:transcriptional regulator GlxA family with amidase domain